MRTASSERPGEGEVVAIDAAGDPQHRYGDVIPRPGMTGDVAGLALYAGQSAGLVHDVQPAGRLVERIAAQATAVIAGLRDPA
jgi:nitronate monooxygenase/enoyl-[acyl-carrier protein] reductase II